MNRIFVKVIKYRKRERVFYLILKKKLVNKYTITYFQRKLMLIKNGGLFYVEMKRVMKFNYQTIFYLNIL